MKSFIDKQLATTLLLKDLWET